MTTSYRAAGVDVQMGDAASQILFSAARKTWENRAGRFGQIQSLQTHFRTSRFFDAPPQAEDICLGCNFDGVGTKIELSERLRNFTGVALDLFAMVCDDAAVQGAEPVHVGSVIDMAKVDLHIVEQLARGLVDAAAESGVAVINGELAELPGRITGYGVSPVNWNGACFWAAKKSTISSFTAPRLGDDVIGVSERGFRSNGFSLVRKIFRSDAGEHWGASSDQPLLDLIRFAAQPSIIYTPYVLSLTGGLENEFLHGLRGFIHVTGGGLLGRALYYSKSNDVHLRINDDLKPPQGMCDICELGVVPLEEAYRTWNMGIGLLIVCDPSITDAVLEAAADHTRMQAAVVGSVDAGTGVSMTFYDGKTHEFSR